MTGVTSGSITVFLMTRSGIVTRLTSPKNFLLTEIGRGYYTVRLAEEAENALVGCFIQIHGDDVWPCCWSI
jgi:hypothetical protein